MPDHDSNASEREKRTPTGAPTGVRQARLPDTARADRAGDPGEIDRPTTLDAVRASLGRSPGRWILLGLGLLCVVLAAVGIVVPGMPTTIFLILASYLFTRSCPILEEKLLGIRIFRPYVAYVRGDRPMPRRARIVAAAMMWTAVAGSLALLASRQVLVPWIACTIVAAALAGTATLMLWRRPAPVPVRRSPRSARSD